MAAHSWTGLSERPVGESFVMVSLPVSQRGLCRRLLDMYDYSLQQPLLHPASIGDKLTTHRVPSGTRFLAFETPNAGARRRSFRAAAAIDRCCWPIYENNSSNKVFSLGRDRPSRSPSAPAPLFRRPGTRKSVPDFPILPFAVGKANRQHLRRAGDGKSDDEIVADGDVELGTDLGATSPRMRGSGPTPLRFPRSNNLHNP